MRPDVEFLTQLTQAPAVLVRVDAARGSVPREVGAWMAVFAGHVMGTVGGGHLEWQAIAHARERLETPSGEVDVVRFALGPTLGQCCGGEVHLRFQNVVASDSPWLREQLAPVCVPVAIFGGGHVGHALVQVLARLPMDIIWVDSRDAIFPAGLPHGVQCEHSAPVEGAVTDLKAGTSVLIMSFSHAEDLEVVAACLRRQRDRGDLPFVGLIGSKTKWAAFRSRLAQRGFTEAELAHITCPIGVAGITDKHPEVIAVAVAAQLLQVGTS